MLFSSPMRLHKGDRVKVTVGKDRGRSGKILRIDTQKETVLVEGLNLYKKHKRPTRQGEKGQVISVNRPMSWVNVQLLCQACERPTRIGVKIEGEKKIRTCKKCGANV